MPKNPDLNRALQRLEIDCENLSIEDAVKKIDEVIVSNEKYRIHFEVYKANYMWAAGKTNESVALLERCTSVFNDDEEVHYFAGEHLLELGDFALALRYLSRCIEISTLSEDKWYEVSARLLRAYCAAKVGQHDLAAKDLTSIDDGESMEWLNASPTVSKLAISQMLMGK